MYMNQSVLHLPVFSISVFCYKLSEKRLLKLSYGLLQSAAATRSRGDRRNCTDSLDDHLLRKAVQWCIAFVFM